MTKTQLSFEKSLSIAARMKRFISRRLRRKGDADAEQIAGSIESTDDSMSNTTDDSMSNSAHTGTGRDFTVRQQY